MDLEALGLMAQLPDDVSPLKIGSRGKYKNSAFEIVGRLKVAWSEGCWNEWLLLLDDGKYGWLAEAMGFFMLSFEIKETGQVPKSADLAVGKGYELAPMQTFFVDDIKEAVCVGSEGELPFKAESGRKTTSVDLSTGSGEFANIEYSERDGVRLYVGRYVEFDDLALTDLRDLAADIKRIRSAELFKCPSCGGPFSLLTPGLTASVACQYCGSVIDTTNRTLSLLDKAEKQMKIKPLIPIGSKGTLSGAEWEVTGFMRRGDEAGQYPWDEYLLFNPFRGFRWLTTYNGHWNFVEMLHIRPWGAGTSGEIKLGDKTFSKFADGKAKVLYVLGEFYWRVRTGDTVAVADYISPPEILSSESDASEAAWSLGHYIEPLNIGQAFGLEGEMPAAQGVAANQLSPYKPLTRHLWLSFCAFLVCLTLLQFYFGRNAGKTIYQGAFTFARGETAQPIVTPSFDIQGDSVILTSKLFSPVQNDWMAASVELVNDSTNQSIGFEQGVEYYSGTDSDGSWSEGSRGADRELSGIPGGRYHLVIRPSSAKKLGKDNSGSKNSGPEKTDDMKFDLLLYLSGPSWCNYFMALFLVALYPLCMSCKSSRFESARWAESSISSAKADGDSHEN
jgi:hypothetical protein